MRRQRTATPYARRSLQAAYALSAVVAVLLAAASLAGRLFPAELYPTEDVLHAFSPTDVVDLALGLPILVVSIWLARRGKLLGLLLWPGALLFVLYTHIVYVFAMPLSAVYLLHLALVTASAYALAGVVSGVDGAAVKRRLAGAVPERLAGGVLAGLGLLFALRVVFTLVSAVAGAAPVARTELGLNVSDIVIAPSLVIGGTLLWRKSPLGYVTGLGLLFQASTLFAGLIAIMLMRPGLTGVPVVVSDVIVVAVFGLSSFVPLALYTRGVLRARHRGRADASR